MHIRKLVRRVVCLTGLIGATGVLLAQQPPAASQTIRGGADPRQSNTADKDLLYVVAGGGAINDNRYGGEGVLVYDTWDWKLIQRIELPEDETPAWQGGRARVDAISIDAATRRLYVARHETYAYDLMTEKLLWTAHVGGRIAVSPDGSKLYGGDQKDANALAVFDTKTGNQIASIKTDKTRGTHNTIVSLDGSRVFKNSTSIMYVSVADTATNAVVQVVGPFSQQPRVYTINGAANRIYMTMVDLLGFEIGDVTTGKVIHRVEVPGYGANRARVATHGTPSHGIAMSPDEKEVWVVDSVNGGFVHVFDNTAMPPKYMTTIKLRHEHPGWISFSLDGKWVYPSTGDIIDAATKKVVAGLFDDFGRSVQSEAMVDVRFSMRERKPILSGNSFGIGHVRPTGTASGF